MEDSPDGGKGSIFFLYTKKTKNLQTVTATDVLSACMFYANPIEYPPSLHSSTTRLEASTSSSKKLVLEPHAYAANQAEAKRGLLVRVFPLVRATTLPDSTVHMRTCWLCSVP